MKKIILFLILFLMMVGKVEAVVPDQRFGFGGSPQIAKDLNIPWFYNWAVTIPIAGQKSFMVVGKINCANPDISALISSGLKDEDDRNRYTRLETIISKFEGKPLTNGIGRDDYGGSRVCVKENGARKTFLQIAATLANAYPGSFYQITNEPDWYPYFTPEDYAEYYNIFYTQIKKYDPSARVATGGLTSVSPIIYANQAYYSYDPSNRFRWIDDFRNSYKNKFGSFPPVDIWDIHTYQPSGTSLDWNLTKNMIVDFRDTYLTHIGEQNKPVWITEFGLLIKEGWVVHPGNGCTTHGCLSDADQILEWNMVANDFMKPLINWMKSNNYVQKWFWYYAGQSSTFMPDGLDLVGDTYLLSNGEYTPMGTMYKQLAEEGAEKIPNCSIDSGPTTITLGETATYNASFSSNQGNLGTRLSIGQNGKILEDIKGTVSYQSNTAATGTFSWKPKSTGTFEVFCRAWNDSVAECRGNPFYVDKLPRYECAGPKAYMTAKVVVPGDFNSDGHVDIFDYNLMVSKFGNPYTIFDYNDLLGNFGL